MWLFFPSHIYIYGVFPSRISDFSQPFLLFFSKKFLRPLAEVKCVRVFSILFFWILSRSCTLNCSYIHLVKQVLRVYCLDIIQKNISTEGDQSLAQVAQGCFGIHLLEILGIQLTRSPGNPHVADPAVGMGWTGLFQSNDSAVPQKSVLTGDSTETWSSDSGRVVTVSKYVILSGSLHWV